MNISIFERKTQVEQQFLETLATHNIQLTSKQKEQFTRYYELLIEWNQKMNLTAITDKDQVYLKHFLDSASSAFFFDFTSITSLCDVGSGAGFPSLVLKIIFPHLKITIVEALNKRLTFLAVVIAELKLTDVELVHERAEIYGRTQREYFDVVTARAVARFKMLAELCVPLVKKGGTFLAMKGTQGDNEYADAATMLKTLGITAIKEEKFMLPQITEAATETRMLYFCHKGKTTPGQYPRSFAAIKKANQ